MHATYATLATFDVAPGWEAAAVAYLEDVVVSG
jgi:hypothetical protein